MLMDRNKEAARRSNLAASNGLSSSKRRRSSSSVRDSHEEDGQMVRDRVNKRDLDRYQGREFSNQKIQNKRKRRRGDGAFTLGNSTEESGADEEEYFETQERRVTNMISHNITTSFSSSSLLNHTSRKSLPRKTVTPTRLVKQAPPMKPADDMIGVLVPRKARSASVKRSYENWVSGNGGFWEDHRASSTSQASRSGDVNSPSSSNVSVRKKMKPNEPQTRLPKAAKSSSSSVQPEDIEIEIAEVLFGLMKQSQNSKEDSIINTVQKIESKEANSISGDIRSSISVLSQNEIPASDPLDVSGGAPKKKRVETDNSSNSVQNSSNASAVNFENELPEKIEISARKSEKISQSNVESSGASPRMDAPEVASVTVEPQEDVVIKQGDSIPSIERSGCGDGPVTEKKLVSADKESASCSNMAVNFQDSSVTQVISTVLENETESRKDEKFKFDLMAPPPERDDFNDFASDPTIKSHDLKMKLVKNEVPKKETSVGKDDEKKIVAMGEKCNLKFDLGKPNQDNGRNGTIKLQQPQQPKPTVPKVEKTAQSNSVPLQMAVAGWSNGLPPLGYIPPFQAPLPIDGSIRSTVQQPTQFMPYQPRPKRCATHHYIARNIYLDQQFTKMKHFWPAGAGSASLCGVKANNLNVMPSTDKIIHGNPFQGSLPVVNLNSSQDKGQAVVSFQGPTKKDKSSEGVNFMDPAQRKQLVHQQTPQPAPAGKFLHAPAFIFPLSQQQAVVTAAANQPEPSKSAASTIGASLSSNSTAALPASSAALPAVASAMSYNYPNLAANEAPYLTILQNNGYPFPVSTPIGTPPAIRGGGAHAQSLPFFGSFYSSQVFHPSQIQQQQPHSQKTSTSNASSSSHKQLPPLQKRGEPVSRNNILSSPSNMQSQQPPKQHVPPTNQNRKHEVEANGDNNSSLTDNRSSHSQTNMYGQNFSVPLQPLNFAMMQSPVIVSGSAGGNHSEKQQQSQQKGLKGGVELIPPPQAFAMSFASFSGSNMPSNLNFSSMAHNSAIFQSLPDVSRQGYQVTPCAVQQKNNHISEAKTRGTSSNHDDGKKAGLGKSPTTSGQTLVFDNSTRTLNFVSSCPATGNWPTRSITSTTNAPVVGNSQNIQQQQLLQFQKQQQPQQSVSEASRSKTPTNSMPSSNTKFSTNVPIFQQSNSCSQSPQWKNNNATRTPTCQSSNTSTVKNVPQQQVRSPQGHTQISFERNSKSGLASPGQQQSHTGNQTQSQSPLVVGSPPPSSGGNMKTSSTGSKVGSSSIPTIQSQQTENSSSQKSSSVCGRNVPSILSTCLTTSLNSNTKF